MNVKQRSRDGVALFIVIAVLGVLFFASAYFMSTTIDQGRQTGLSLRGLQAQCLAEAAIERTLRLLYEDLKDSQNLDPEKGKPESFAVLLRLPRKLASAAGAGTTGSLGKDDELDFTGQREFIYGKPHLRLKPEGEDELDKLVGFMTQGAAKEWDAVVNVKIEKAYRIAPGRENDFKVPGVEAPWSIRDDVKYFLDGNGYCSFFLQFPPDMKLLDFNFPVEVRLPVVGKIRLFNINLTSMVDTVFTTGVTAIGLDRFLDRYVAPDKSAGEGYISKILSLDFYADLLFNKLIAPGRTPPVYPLAVTLDHLQFPLKVGDLWPKGVITAEPTGDDAYGKYLEKYGEIKISCEASITTQDGHVTTRRIEGTKEFRVSDIEPPAPMYSLFIENTFNKDIQLDRAGGDLYVNNLDLSGVFTKFKDAAVRVVTGAAEDPDKPAPEIPGLVRVNFANGEDGMPITVTSTLVGDPFSATTSPIDPEDNVFKSLIRGMDALMVLNAATDLAMMGGETSVITRVERQRIPVRGRKKKSPDDPRHTVIQTRRTFESTGVFHIGQEEQNKKSVAEEKRQTDKPEPGKRKFDPSKHPRDVDGRFISKAQAKYNEWFQRNQGRFEWLSKLNFIPNVAFLSCSPMELVMTLAVKPLVEGAVNNLGISNYTSFLSLNDCFQTWEMPYFGTEWKIYTMPYPIWYRGSTHLFGAGSMHPTLTKEIEGKVAKMFRQWKMCIVGLNPMDMIPIPFPPFRLPPIPVPIWYTGKVVNKYGYNFLPLRSFNPVSGEIVDSMREYDPEDPDNWTPNLYTTEQYAKKAAWFYASGQDFENDLKNRLVTLPNGEAAFMLDGVTYIAGSLGSREKPFKPVIRAADGTETATDTLNIIGRGMIVCSGNIFLSSSFRAIDYTDEKTGVREKTVFSLMAREGGIVYSQSSKPGGLKFYNFEGSLYTDKGIFLPRTSSLHVIGNLVTNDFTKSAMQGTTVIDYVSSRVRTSLGSLHPERGKFDPHRYHVSLGPIWTSWRSF